MKIIVGAGGTTQNEWLSFEADSLDIRDRRSWRALFLPGSLDAVLSEHVLEHLHEAEAVQTARNVYEFLRPGGYWRIAVPDGFNPNPDYFEHSRPGGFYQTYIQPLFGDYPNHKLFFNINSLSKMLSNVGFRVSPLEWYEADGTERSAAWTPEDGRIFRARGTEYVETMRLLLGFDNTSLIVDAIK